MYGRLSQPTRDPRRRAAAFTAASASLDIAYGDTSIVAGKVQQDPDFAHIKSQYGDEDPAHGEDWFISVLYKRPKIQVERKSEILPDQPPISRNYRLIARIRRPINKVAKRWIDAEDALNHGRTAETVATEYAQFRATGRPPSQLPDWLKTIRGTNAEEEEEEEVLFRQLPHNFDGFLLPQFPQERTDLDPRNIWGDGDDDDDNDDDDDDTVQQEALTKATNNMRISTTVAQSHGGRMSTTHRVKEESDDDAYYTDDEDRPVRQIPKSKKQKQLQTSPPAKKSKVRKQKTVFEHKPIKQEQWD